MKTVTFHSKSVQLILENNEIEELAAEASINLNPNVLWAKIVLTDDKFNANKQRIPRSEFANVIRTGLYMPLKMAYGEISEGHADTFPIGTLAHLKTEGDTVQALAAIWTRERETDAELMKKRFKSGKPLDVSWEITYSDFDEEDGGQSLKNISMNAATLVGAPAYGGRTTVIALSQLDIYDEAGEIADECGGGEAAVWTYSYIKSLPDSAFLCIDDTGRHLPVKNKEGKYDIPHLQNAVQRAPQMTGGACAKKASALQERARRLLARLKGGESSMEEISIEKHDEIVAELKKAHDQELKESNDKLEAAQAELKELKPKVEGLEQFKTEVEAERAKAAKLDAIKKKFADAGIEADDKYFDEKGEALLAMADAQLDFFVQELVAAFSEKKEEASDETKEGKASISITSKNVPNLQRKASDDEVSTDDIVAFLKKGQS